MMKLIYYIIFSIISCNAFAQTNGKPYIIVLGVAQDGGYPHMGCTKKCCNMAWKDHSMKKNVVSLALVDPASKRWWLMEASPDIKEQLHDFRKATNGSYNYLPAGIFITHAHIGHYTGLMQLGKEVMSTSNIPVYTLPKMSSYLANNGPWSQLEQQHNIILKPLTADSTVELTPTISIKAFTVPHRDEYSETAGFKIVTTGKKYLFIPDINKWDKWDKDIRTEVDAVDIALLDATFYSNTELPGRSMSEVPHPLVTETMSLFAHETERIRAKIRFIHFNHTNPLLWDAEQKAQIKKEGFTIATQGEQL